MRRLLIAGLLTLAAAPVAAQVLARPTDAPQVSAAGESWYQLREPIQYAGEAVLPGRRHGLLQRQRDGAHRPLQRRAAVRRRHARSVQRRLRADRRRTAAALRAAAARRSRRHHRQHRCRRSRSRCGPTARSMPMAATAPTNLPLSVGAISAFTPEVTPPVVFVPAVARRAGLRAATRRRRRGGAAVAVPPLPTDRVARPQRPPARQQRRRLDPLRRRDVGEHRRGRTAHDRRSRRWASYAGFPVFRKQDGGSVIYLESRDGLLAPYRRKG